MLSYEMVVVALAPYEMALVECSDTEAMIEARQTYLSILSGMGWTESDLDKEMMKRIDREWDEIIASEDEKLVAKKKLRFVN